MTIGIIAAMAEELKELLVELTDKEEVLVLGRTYYKGQLRGQDVVLVQSGVGKVMSAMSVAVLVDRFKVDALINTGSAGAVAPGLAVGDVVLADKLAYHDVDLTAFGYAYGQMSGQPLYFESGPDLLASFERVLSQSAQAYKVGLITTSDSFIASEERIAEIKAQFPAVLAVEMEGAAIAQAAHSVGKPVIVVRAMSDTADHSANISFDDFILEAGKRSAEVVLGVMAELSNQEAN